MNLTKFALKNPWLVIIFWASVLIFGMQCLRDTPIDFLPESKSLDIAIHTAYPGAAKERVLEQVTKQLEWELVQLKGIRNVISTTQNESSQILLHFAFGTTEEEVLSSVLVAVNTAKAKFPEGVINPSIQVVEPAQLPILRVAMSSPLPPAEFYNFACHAIKPRFETMERVSRVEILGQRQKQLTVHLNLKKMGEREITASEVVRQLGRIGQNIYLGKEGSYFLAGTISSASDLGKVAVRYLANDKVVSLKEIAEIREELSEPDAYTYFNGEPCLILEIFARSDADLLEIERSFSEKLDKLQKELSKGKEKVSLSLLTSTPLKLTYIEDDFRRNIVIAIFVAMLLIALVFKDLRSIVISSTSIPTSLCGTFIVMQLLGYTLNSFTIPAVIISIGLVIDDMIVIRENIFRHLEEGLSPFQATLKGMEEVTKPVIGTTCMVFSVCMPLIVLTGTETGQYWRNFGITMLAGMAFSLLEALTLGPLLCAYCLKPRGHAPFKQPIQDLIRAFYDRVLNLVKGYSHSVMGGGAILMVLGFVVCSLIRSENMPANSVGSIEMSLRLEADTPIGDVQKKVVNFSELLFKRYPDIAKIGICIRNRTEAAFYLQMVEESERKISAEQLTILLEKEGEELVQRQQIVSYNVDAQIISLPFRVRDYTVQLNSYNKEMLEEYSAKLFEALQKFDGLANLENSSDVVQRGTAFQLDFEKMNELGVLTHPVQNELNLLLNGYEIAQYHPLHQSEAIKREIKVKTDIPPLSQGELLDRAQVPNVNQMLIPFREITKGTAKESSEQIMRKNRQEFTQLTADENRQCSHESLLNFTDKLMKRELPVPKEISFSWGGITKQAKEMIGMEPLLALLAAFFIYTALLILYRSMTMPLVIFLPLPMSIAASFFALYLSGHTINTYSIIGILIIAGLAAKNGIVLIDYTNLLISRGVHPSDAIFIASKVRLRAILMSSFAVFLTTLPVLIVWDEYSKVQVSLATAILGGLITSTLFTLFIIPVFFKYTYRFHGWVSRYFSRSFNADLKIHHRDTERR